MNQRKTLEIMWVNVKVREKREEKAFMKEVTIFQSKKTPIPIPVLIQLHPGKVPLNKPHKHSSYTNI